VPKKVTRFNVLFTEAQHQKLVRLADHLEISRGALIRMQIQALHRMLFENTPLCVDGQRCLVAHLHDKSPAQIEQESKG